MTETGRKEKASVLIERPNRPTGLLVISNDNAMPFHRTEAIYVCIN